MQNWEFGVAREVDENGLCLLAAASAAVNVRVLKGFLCYQAEPMKKPVILQRMAALEGVKGCQIWKVQNI
ncbi:MAG: hypothetical protein QM762_26615 [Chryseolinea sp.]